MNNYYKELFTSSLPNEEIKEEFLENLDYTLSNNAKNLLDQPISREEIRRVTFDLGTLKAPRTDGLQATFYQEYWDIEGEDVIDTTLEFLNQDRDIKEINKTLITLIPKTSNPENPTQYKPINLCNEIYKIIAKTLANRLKIVLNEIISPNQGAFIKGRQITDNIMIAHEILRHMKVNKNTNKYMDLKLDMRKAYDMVERDYLKTSL